MKNESKIISINDSVIKVQIWDTAGQEKYKSMSRKGYQNADAIILVYDVKDKKSFESINTWVDDIKTNSKEDILMALLANKIDMNDRVISKEEGLKLAEKYNIKYFECSCKFDINVTETIVYLTQEIFLKGEKKRNIMLEDNVKKVKSSKTCC